MAPKKSKSKSKSKSPNKRKKVTAPTPQGDAYQLTFGYSSLDPANCKAGSDLRPLRTQTEDSFKRLVENLTNYPWDTNSVITGKEDVPEEGTPERPQYPVPLQELIHMTEEDVSSESRFHYFFIPVFSLFFFR